MISIMLAPHPKPHANVQCRWEATGAGVRHVQQMQAPAVIQLMGVHLMIDKWLMDREVLRGREGS